MLISKINASNRITITTVLQRRRCDNLSEWLHVRSTFTANSAKYIRWVILETTVPGLRTSAGIGIDAMLEKDTMLEKDSV